MERKVLFAEKRGAGDYILGRVWSCLRFALIDQGLPLDWRLIRRVPDQRASRTLLENIIIRCKHKTDECMSAVLSAALAIYILKWLLPILPAL
jgi:hypothetical protein